MLLIAHIVLALSSLPLMLGAVINEFAPFVANKWILPVASAVSFVGLVGTGTALIIVQHLPIFGACIDGLMYLAGLSVLYAFYKKLSRKHSAE